MFKVWPRKKPRLGIILSDPRATIPNYAHPGDSGLDVYPLDFFRILPGQRKLIKLGFSLNIPPGYEVQVRPRSGLAIKAGVTVVNTPGTVDQSYQGEVGVILINHGEEVFRGSPTKAIAQLVLAPVAIAIPKIIENYNLEETSRGLGAYGSTDELLEL
jgi:dUTP pyrophosphatase